LDVSVSQRKTYSRSARHHFWFRKPSNKTAPFRIKYAARGRPWTAVLVIGSARELSGS
jgi:hypothetical protein